MYSVLVVDDVIENIDILTGILREEYHVKAATNGKTALRIAEKTLPDLILLDIVMPEMDGYDVCSLLKRNPLTRNIPVIYVTTKDTEFNEVKGFEMGAVDYISKPVSPTVTKARIKTHIALSDQKKALEMEVHAKTEEIHHTRLQVIKRLSHAAEYKDSDTGLHIERVSRYCYHMAREYGLSEIHADLLLNASPMHDIGKIGIADSILKKPGKLNQEEWSVMTLHTTIGGDIIGASDTELLQLAKTIAEQHHEKWNGQGYPEGLKGTQIDVFARIVATADVFDALTSKRPYKDAWPVEKAIDLVKDESGQHFDPQVVTAFINALPTLLEVKKDFAD